MMKIYYLLLIPFILFAQLASFGFEETGTPTGITVLAGTPDFDYTTTVLEQTQSCYIDATSATGGFGFTFTAQTEAWFFFSFQFQINNGTSDNTIFYIRNDGDTAELGRLIMYRDGRSRFDAGTPAPLSVSTFTENTTYYCWIRYKAGTGANAEYDIYISTSTTKPETPDITGTNGTNTGNPGAVRIYATQTNATLLIDAVKVSATAIGDYTAPVSDTGQDKGFKETPKFKKFPGWR